MIRDEEHLHNLLIFLTPFDIASVLINFVSC